MKGLEGSSDVERILVRDELLARVGDDFAEAVHECIKRFPIAELAGFIDGDRDDAPQIAAGPRQAIVEIVRARFPSGAFDHVAGFVRFHEPGHIPCVFVVRLSGGAIDVSTVALNIPAEVAEASARAHPGNSGIERIEPPAVTPERDAEIAAFIRERDAVLLDPDLNRLRRHMAARGRPQALEASDEVMRMAWHKARTGATSLPRAERRRSIRWLEKRGYKHLADEGGGESN